MHMGATQNETRTDGLLRGAQHRGDSSRGVWLATWATEAMFGQFGGNLPEWIWPPIGVAPEPPRQIDHFRVPLGVAFTAAALFPRGYFAITGRLQLGDRGGLVELGYGTKHLANQDRGRRVFGEKVRRRRRNQCYPELSQMVMSGQLHRQITGETVRTFYNDRTDAVAGNALQNMAAKPGRSVIESAPRTALS